MWQGIYLESYKLVEECNENINETSLVEKTLSENKHENKCSFCTLNIVLFSIILAINVGIAAYFAYYKYMNRNKNYQTKDY